MVTDEELQVIETIKLAYIEAGSKSGPPCCTKSCVHLAMMRVFWPVAEHEDYPLYCYDCGLRALAVLKTMGYRAESEVLPEQARQGQTRIIHV